MAGFASRKNIYTVTSTNAHYLDDGNARKTVESGLSRIIISIDGTTQESYQQYRVGGSLQKVIEGAKNLVNWKRKLKSATPYVIFQMVVFSHNENETGSLARLANECGADEVKLKTAQIYDFGRGSKLIPVNKKFSRYVQPELTFNGFQIKNPLLNHCWKMWHSCVVTWDGLVVPCCFDKDATHVMGDLKKQSFREIWNGEAYREFRSRLLRSRKGIDICSNCSEGTKVWA
jgi:radical SAM protein with 4Fe4S-binding SPASM domain